ncbi:TPA: hypothetical protein MAK64_000186 [Klebsiella aerogenes]|nr:hypothetical protein [Klebsiella aerogenes]
MTLNKLIIIAISALSINTCAFAAGSLADQLHYTSPEPADLAVNPQTELPESKTEQPKLAMTPDVNAYTYYNEKVNPVTNDIERIEQGGVVEF